MVRLLLFSHWVISDSGLQLHGLQHTRLPCPSLSPRVCSNSCPLSQWCYPTISSSVAPFSFCLQSLPPWGYFPMRQLFASSGQSTGASALASVLPMNIQDWFSWGLTGLISLCPRTLRKSSPAPPFKSISSAALSLLYGPTLTSAQDYRKPITLIIQTIVGKVMKLYTY